MSLDLADFDFLTFDCYGTIVDWERGLLAALDPYLAKLAERPDDSTVLYSFAELEPEAERTNPTLPYPEVLARVFDGLVERFGFEVDEAEAAGFAYSVAVWPLFADSAEALQSLAQRYQLGVLSNVDRASFAITQAQFGISLDGLWTAQDIGSYKPDPRNFEFMLADLAEHGVARERVLHVAQSQYHDVRPAQAAGLKVVWVDRRGHAGGATPEVEGEVTPDMRVTSLAELAEHAGRSGKPLRDAAGGAAEA